MARLFPLRSETSAREGSPRVVDLEGEDADAVFSALSSTTARRIYTTLSEEPGTPSDVADAIDSSIQNVRYHLEKLEDAGLVEVVDTWYSSRGNEMSVYATTDGPLIVTSDESRATQLKDALSRFLGGVAGLAGASFLVQFAVEQYFSPSSGTGGGDWFGGFGGEDDSAESGDAGSAGGDGDGGGAGADGSDGGDGGGDGAAMDAEDDAAGDGAAGADDGFSIQEESDEGVDAADAEATEVEHERVEVTESTSGGETPTSGGNESADATANAADGAVEATDAFVSTIPPGLLFFLGGLVVLTAVAAWWYWSARRPAP